MTVSRLLVVGRRAGWGVADQGLSSLTNFALGIAVAREVSSAEFGAFGITYATFLVVMGISRSVGTDPLAVRFSASSEREWRIGSTAATGSALAVGIAAGIICGVVGTILQGTAGLSLIALGVSLPGLMLQDSWRYIFFAKGEGSRAFINDLVWTTALIPSIGFALTIGDKTVMSFVLAWGAAGTLAGIFGIYQSRILPAPLGAASWWKRNSDLAPYFLGEFIAYGGTTQLTTYGIGLVTSLSVLGAFRAAEILMGPLNVLVLGLNMVAVPEGVRAIQTSPARLRFICALFAAAVAGASLLLGIIIWALPDSAGESLLGASWKEAHRVILLLAIVRAASGVGAAAGAGLRALGAARRSLGVRLIGAPVVIFTSVGGAALWGLIGAARGMAISACLLAAVWWFQLERALPKGPRSGSESVTKFEWGLN